MAKTIGPMVLLIIIGSGIIFWSMTEDWRVNKQNVDFENDEHFKIGLTAPIWNNSDSFWHLFKEYPAGENPIFPKIPNLFDPSTDVFHSGKQSAKLSLLSPQSERARRINIQHNLDPENDKHIWLEVWYYLPDNFPVDDWTDLHRAAVERLWDGDGYEWFQITCEITRQSKISDTEYKIMSNLNHGWVDNNGDGNNDLPDRYQVFSKDPIRFGRWFKITTYIYRDPEHGAYKLWIDDALQWDLKHIRTVGILPKRIAEIGDHNTKPKGFLCCGFGLYSGNLPNVSPKFAFYDDITLKVNGRSQFLNRINNIILFPSISIRTIIK